MRLRPDDEVYRVDAVWLGPRGLTLPWSARYSAYGIWLVLFVTVLLVEAALPMSVSVPPVWELVLTILATYALTGVIDHDRQLMKKLDHRMGFDFQAGCRHATCHGRVFTHAG